MKFNWGSGIFIAIVVCVSALLFLVYLTSKEKIDLVTKEYYPEELRYEEELVKLRNTAELTKNLHISIRDSIYIYFPFEPVDGLINGEIWIYRPSDINLDKKITFKDLDNEVLAYPISGLKKGKYEIIIDWNYRGKSYLYKEVVLLN